MGTVKDRVLQIRENIREICRRTGRNPDEVVLVAITKYTDADKVREAISAGITHIGENRVQDAEKKFLELGDLTGQVTRHMVGHLQTNKAKDALKLFDVIQSLDSERLAFEIEKRAAALGIEKVKALIEVNSGEEQKSGVNKNELTALVEKVTACPHIQLQGLMTMAPLTTDKYAVRQAFRDLRLLSGGIAARFQGHPQVEMKYLSMGMTDDYEIALEEGSNMLRIGRAIFKD